jgi:tRNA (cytidine/uridine-2'-O-)-methyltransferase
LNQSAHERASPTLNVVLVHPEIPPNTGNIGRLCCAVGARLHLVKPLGFHLSDRYLRRAGLDYWDKVDVVIWEELEQFLASVNSDRIVLTSSKRGEPYHEVNYKPEDYIVFGAETAGLPPVVFERFPERIARVPVRLDQVRSLNLSTSAGIIVYEALRQIGRLPE